VSCESPTELKFSHPLSATTFCFHIIQCFFEVFRIIEHCLNIGCPRKCNSYSHQPCHLALNKPKSNTCQVSKKSSWNPKYFSDPPKATTFNVCTPQNEKQPLVPFLHFKYASPTSGSSLVVFSLAPPFDNRQISAGSYRTTSHQVFFLT